jgi:putative membrane protein
MVATAAMLLISNRTTSMNTKSTFFSRFAILAVTAGTLCAAAVVWAQTQEFEDVTGNPYLRKPAPKPKTTATVKPRKPMAAQDQKFLVGALGAGVWEVENGKAAQSRAQNASTRRVAEHLVAANSRLNQEIVALAEKKGLGLSPQGSGPQKISGAHYDKDYLTLAKQDHHQNIRLFEKEARSGSDPDLKRMAAGALPGLRQQLGAVEEALGKTK